MVLFLGPAMLNSYDFQYSITHGHTCTDNESTFEQHLHKIISHYNILEKTFTKPTNEISHERICKALFMAIEQKDEATVIKLLPYSKLLSFSQRGPHDHMSFYYTKGEAQQLLNFALEPSIRYNVVQAILMYINRLPQNNNDRRTILTFILLYGFEKEDLQLIALALEYGAFVHDPELRYYAITKLRTELKALHEALESPEMEALELNYHAMTKETEELDTLLPQVQEKHLAIVDLLKKYGVPEEKIKLCEQQVKEGFSQILLTTVS